MTTDKTHGRHRNDNCNWYFLDWLNRFVLVKYNVITISIQFVTWNKKSHCNHTVTELCWMLDALIYDDKINISFKVNFFCY